MRPPAMADPEFEANPEAEKQAPPDRFELAERRLGTILDGKWKLEELLGVGGMAAVYAATHRNGAKAAIKLLTFGLATGPELCQRLLREGYLANKIQHKAVVRVLDDHIDYKREHAYIVMELLEGETARQYIEYNGSFEPLQAVELILELCDCLEAAHAAQIVHRDIKPENLFLTDDGLKVLDFGIARGLDGNSSLTQTGISLGTPSYMAPEQARGKQAEISARSDLYSVGATLLFLLTGETLHHGENPMEIMVKAAWTPAPPARSLCPELPDSIARIIDRCCAFEPDDRYPDAATLREDLQRARAELSASPAAALPSRPSLIKTSVDAETLDANLLTLEKPRNHKMAWLGAGAVAIALAAIGIISSRVSSEASSQPTQPLSRKPAEPTTPLHTPEPDTARDLAKHPTTSNDALADVRPEMVTPSSFGQPEPEQESAVANEHQAAPNAPVSRAKPSVTKSFHGKPRTKKPKATAVPAERKPTSPAPKPAVKSSQETAPKPESKFKWNYEKLARERNK